MKRYQLGLIGAGHMGEALLRGVLQRGTYAPQDVVIHDPRPSVTEALITQLGVTSAPDNGWLVDHTQTVILAIKPQVLFEVLAPVAARLTPDHTVISVAAGVPLSALHAALPRGVPVVRAMPNTPSLIGAGVTGISVGPAAQGAHAARAARIFEAVGLVRQIPEDQMDALTAVSGCGPAYVFHLIEGLVLGGVEVGLDHELATELAIETVFGAASLARRSDADPGTLTRRVMSPGGVTERAIRSLIGDDFQGALRRAIDVARDRSRAMAAEQGSSAT